MQPLSKILTELPSLTQAQDWDRAYPLIDRLNDIVSTQASIEQQLNFINQQLESPSYDQQQLRLRRQDLTNDLKTAQQAMRTLQSEYNLPPWRNLPLAAETGIGLRANLVAARSASVVQARLNFRAAAG